MGVRRRLAALASLCVVGAACSSSPSHQAAVATTSTPQVTAPAACAAASPFGTSGRPNEVRGASSDAELWGLALGPVPPRVGDELKMVWRMTGTGPLHVTFTAPDGRDTPLVFGPDAHAASNYQRPGDEWGTGFRFTAKGCWHIHLTRDNTSGDVWVGV